jgi:hypothetical protein
MKKTTYLMAIVLLFTSYTTFSQNCNLVIKDGSKLTLTFYSWTNPNLYDPKFQKLKQDKKDEQILAYNQSVLTGKLAPASASPMTFTTKKITSTTGGDEYIVTTTIAGKDYSGYALCKNDTLYSIRNKGVIYLLDAKGDSLGFTIQSPQILPTKMKVGDKLPTYEDISFVNPTASKQRLKMVYTKSIPETDTHYAGSVWGTVEVNGKQTLSFSSRMIHYVNAEVTGEEEVVISGTTYKAFIIESETWNKGKMDVSYETSYKDVNDYYAKLVEKGQKKFDKMMLRKGNTNELGFSVSYLKEWFVPTIGIVKSENYDNLGGIGGGMSITGIE